VYNSVDKKGLTNPSHLPLSDHFDTVLCSCVMDADLDGKNELLIGTYGQIILAYHGGNQ